MSTPRSSPTFAEAVARLRQELAVADRRRRVRNLFEARLPRLLDHFGESDCRTIDEGAVAAYAASRQRSGARPRGIRVDLVVLRAVLAAADPAGAPPRWRSQRGDRSPRRYPARTMFRLVTRSSSITHEGQRLTVAFTDETGKKLLSLWSPADDSPWRLGFAWSGETLMDAVERAVLGVGYVTLELIPEAASEGLPGTIHVDFRHAEGASANEVHQTLAEILGDLATTER